MRILANSETRFNKKNKTKYIFCDSLEKNLSIIFQNPQKKGPEMHFSFFIENAKKVQNTFENALGGSKYVTI